ncbi:MAG: tetratricopeptide repeat protein [Isosphaeraceae bacterium]|nr:tetratricopeptide repeat protein [Isosphaeraceae bacterium]
MRWNEEGGRPFWLVFAVLVGGGLVLSAQSWRQEDPQKLWDQGEADLTAGRFAAAEAVIQRLAKLRAPTPHDQMLRAQVSLARERPAEALQALSLIPDSSAVAPQARLLAGQIELRRGRLASAEKQLNEAVRIEPKLVQAHRELIYIYGMLLRRQPLNREFRTLSELTPLTFDNMFHWTLTRSTVWEPRELRSDLERFLKAEPTDRSSRLALAECLRRLGQRDEADATLAPVPDSEPEARAIRVRLALDRGDDLRAEALLKEGPQNVSELAQLRGKLALARGDTEAALREFQRAYAAEPDNRDTLSGLAGAYKRLGRDEEAAPFLKAVRAQDVLASLMTRAAIKGASDDLKLIAELGAVNETLGRLHEARGWYQLVIARDPLNTEAQHAIFRIKAKLAKGAAS